MSRTTDYILAQEEAGKLTYEEEVARYVSDLTEQDIIGMWSKANENDEKYQKWFKEQSEAR